MRDVYLLVVLPPGLGVVVPLVELGVDPGVVFDVFGPVERVAGAVPLRDGMLALSGGVRALLEPGVMVVLLVELGVLPGVVFEVCGPVDVVAGALRCFMLPLPDEPLLASLPALLPPPWVAPVELGVLPGAVLDVVGPVDVVAGAFGGVPCGLVVVLFCAAA